MNIIYDRPDHWPNFEVIGITETRTWEEYDIVEIFSNHSSGVKRERVIKFKPSQNVSNLEIKAMCYVGWLYD